MDDLIAASQRTGVHVGVVFQNRFGGAGVVARRLLTEGVIGRPLVAVCQTLWFRPEQYYDVTWRGRWEIEGGGPTMGLGIHQIDLLRSLIGPWREVSAMAGRLNRRTNTEDVSAASVRFENGALGSIITSLLSPREHSYLRIDTDKVTLEASYGSTGYSDSDWTLTPLPDEHALLERWTTDPGPRSDHGAQLDAVLDALDERAVLPVSLADARETLELVVAIYASAFTGVTVRKGDIVPGHPFYSRTDGPGAPWAAVKH
jgi:predicted dehydrogenase